MYRCALDFFADTRTASRPFDRRGNGEGEARKWIGSGAVCKALNGSEAKRGKLKRTTERNELDRFPPLSPFGFFAFIASLPTNLLVALEYTAHYIEING